MEKFKRPQWVESGPSNAGSFAIDPTANLQRMNGSIATGCTRMWRIAILSVAVTLSLTQVAMAIEEPKFKTIHVYEDFEVRDYAPYLVAETTVKGDFTDAGDEGFRRLFDYISGKNAKRANIAMAAPVIQSGQKIEMAAPVIQATSVGGFAIQFVMPAKWTLATLPVPEDRSVRVREVAPARFAVIRYSGLWTRDRYETNLAKLRRALMREHLTPDGDPIWARYDPPFMPWFLRRNEILIPLRSE